MRACTRARGCVSVVCVCVLLFGQSCQDVAGPVAERKKKKENRAKAQDVMADCSSAATDTDWGIKKYCL